jgi:transposase
MKTRRLNLSTEEILVLEELLSQAMSELSRLRLRAILLYGQGIAVDEVRKELRCSRSSLMSWCQIYYAKGINGLMDGRQGGNNAKLSRDQHNELRQRMIENTPWMVFGNGSATPEGRFWTSRDLYKALKLWYGITYQSRSSYYNLLSRLGFTAIENNKLPIATYKPVDSP